MNGIRQIPTLGFQRCLALLCVCILPLAAQSWEVEIGAGTRDVSGNREMERTLSSLDGGLTLGRLWYEQSDFSENSWLSRLRLEVSGFGARPDGQFNLQLDRDGWYNLRLKFRESQQYDAFGTQQTAFDQPGLLLDPHSRDRRRRALDLDWKFLPGSNWQPFLNLHWTENRGGGVTTAHLGQDEFTLLDQLDAEENQLEIGLAYHDRRFSGEIAQGWRNFEVDESAVLAPGSGQGNNPGSVLGVPESLDNLLRLKHRDGEAPSSRAHLRAELHERLTLQAGFFKSKTEADEELTGVYEGLLLSFRERLVTARQVDLMRASSDVEQTRSEFKAQARLPLEFELDLAFDRSERELDALSHLIAGYEESFLFGSTQPIDLYRITFEAGWLSTETESLEARLGKSFGRFRVWLASTQSDQELSVEADDNNPYPSWPSWVPGSRDLDSQGAGIGYTKAGLRVSAEVWSDEAEGSIFRTDYRDRDRSKLMVKWTFAKWGSLIASGKHLKKENPAPHLNYELESKQGNLGIELEPLKALRFNLNYNKAEMDSTVWVERPQRYLEVLSQNRADSESWNAQAGYSWKSLELTGSWDQYENEGNYDNELTKSRIDFAILLTQGAKIHLEYDRTGYKEAENAAHNFNVSQTTLWFTWRPEK